MLSPNIFLHYLNKDTLEIFGIADMPEHRIVKVLKQGLNASILLCNEYCFMPLGFYFECSQTKQLILQNLDFVSEGFLRFCIREHDLREYVEKKQGQLKEFANDISYHNFFDKNYIHQLISISPIYLQRNIKVGEYCVDKWVEQHNLFLEIQAGDLSNAYQVNNKDISKIITEIKKAAIEIENGAFIWNVIDCKYKKLNITDKELYHKLRMYFEKYYYEAYLKEYNASILYDFFLIDKGYDFYLNDSSRVIANYQLFYNFLKCLSLDVCLNLPAEKIIEVKYLPEYIALLDIYISICQNGIGDPSEFRSIIAKKKIENEKNIDDLSRKVRETIIKPSIIWKEFMFMNNNNNNNNKIDVLILIATDEEEKAILDDNWQQQKTSNGYTYFTKKEKMTFAIARATDMREIETSVVGQYFIDNLKPRYISMVGFCAGQFGKTTLGDIIVPHKVYRYGQGKRVSEEIVYPEIDTYKINPIWKQKVERFGECWREKIQIEKPINYEYQKYIFISELLKSTIGIIPSQLWSPGEMPDIPRIINEFQNSRLITIDSGKIIMTKKGKKNFENELLVKYWDGYKEAIPKTKVGVLATGDDVQQWSDVFDELSKKYDRKTIALDMEAHAIGVMSSFNNIPYIIAKGVGDYAQDGKAFDNRYINYACQMSCRFVIEFFNCLDGPELLN